LIRLCWSSVQESIVLVPPFCSRRVCHLIVRKTAALFAETLAAILLHQRSIRNMKKIIFGTIFILCIVQQPLCYTQSSREDFKVFLKKFFSDSAFQKSRVVFPFHEHPSYIDPKTDEPTAHDTITFANASQWKFIPKDAHQNGSKYTVYTDTLLKSKSKISSNFRVVDFSLKDTDFNLSLVFTLVQNKWFLIRSCYFEP
jgi:hypothetical protein